MFNNKKLNNKIIRNIIKYILYMNIDNWHNPSLISIGLKTIGKQLFSDYIKSLPINESIIEVGSGNGYISSFISDLGYNVIPIDPLVQKYYAPSIDSVLLFPKYESVNRCLMNEPQLIDKCNILLNWCTPNCGNYDYDAIRLLKPKNIIVITELTGFANSNIFQSWLREIYNPFNDITLQYSNIIKQNKFIDIPYNIIKFNNINTYAMNINFNLIISIIHIMRL